MNGQEVTWRLEGLCTCFFAGFMLAVKLRAFMAGRSSEVGLDEGKSEEAEALSSCHGQVCV